MHSMLAGTPLPPVETTWTVERDGKELALGLLAEQLRRMELRQGISAPQTAATARLPQGRRTPRTSRALSPGPRATRPSPFLAFSPVFRCHDRWEVRTSAMVYVYLNVRTVRVGAVAWCVSGCKNLERDRKSRSHVRTRRDEHDTYVRNHHLLHLESHAIRIVINTSQPHGPARHTLLLPSAAKFYEIIVPITQRDRKVYYKTTTNRGKR